ncbi:MAG: hypothetical protein CML51_05870 [Rhodobacteraceae bacterium]|nr:hypothetical protein [Paracoccaceae bacterium]
MFVSGAPPKSQCTLKKKLGVVLVAGAVVHALVYQLGVGIFSICNPAHCQVGNLGHHARLYGLHIVAVVGDDAPDFVVSEKMQAKLDHAFKVRSDEAEAVDTLGIIDGGQEAKGNKYLHIRVRVRVLNVHRNEFEDIGLPGKGKPQKKILYSKTNVYS